MHGEPRTGLPRSPLAPPARCSLYDVIGMLPAVNGSIKNAATVVTIGRELVCGSRPRNIDHRTMGILGRATHSFFLFLYDIEHPTHHDREDVHLQALRFREVRLGCPYPRLSRLPRGARSRPLCT